MGRLRVPLHVKVMISYVLVVALVLVPVLVYLRRNLEKELQQAALVEMEAEVKILAKRLGRAGGSDTVIAEMIEDALADRITIIDREGTVLGDSVVRAGLDSHEDRPEVQ